MDEIVKVRGPVEVELKDLHYQFVPIITDTELWLNDMSLPNSPHVELMRVLLSMIEAKTFIWDEIKKTRYYKDRIFKIEHGMGDKAYAKKKILARYEVLKSIRKHGFKRRGNAKYPIVVLQEPFWKTRFGYEADWLRGPEIWDGGGRCAIAWVFGIRSVPAYIYQDAAPGIKGSAKFEEKLKHVKGLFNNN